MWITDTPPEKSLFVDLKYKSALVSALWIKSEWKYRLFARLSRSQCKQALSTGRFLFYNFICLNSQGTFIYFSPTLYHLQTHNLASFLFIFGNLWVMTCEWQGQFFCFATPEHVRTYSRSIAWRERKPVNVRKRKEILVIRTDEMPRSRTCSEPHELRTSVSPERRKLLTVSLCSR